MNPTTRRFSRTLADAFADERASAIERPAPRPIRALQAVALAVFIGAALMSLICLEF